VNDMHECVHSLWQHERDWHGTAALDWHTPPPSLKQQPSALSWAQLHAHVQ